MKAVRNALVAAVSVAGLLAVLGASPAAASPIDFTWNPSGAGLSTQGAFTADRITVSDYAVIDPSNLSDVVEHAILPITQFQLNGSPVTLSGTPFQLFFQVTAHSTLNAVPTPGDVVFGNFTSIQYTLFGRAGGGCSFGATTAGATSTCGGPLETLLTGTLSAGAGPENNVSVVFGDPAAHGETDIIAGPDLGTFFVSPTDLASLFFESSFTNTPGAAVFASNGDIVINGGGGNVDIIAVPEPITLSLFGAGLVGVTALRRRRQSKKA